MEAEYFQEGCDSLLAVHRILCRATKFRNIMLGKQKYLSNDDTFDFHFKLSYISNNYSMSRDSHQIINCVLHKHNSCSRILV